MDTNRMLQLAGLELLVEKKEVVTEGTKKIEVHVSKKGQPGVLGDLIVIDAFDGMDELAAIIGVPEGWKLTKVGKGFAAYNKGDRMAFFGNKNDFEPDGEGYGSED